MMMRPSTVLLLLLSVVSSSRRNDGVAVGYTTMPIIQQRSSDFAGRDVLAPSSSPSSSRRGGGGTTTKASIEMKKGKANLPSHMRSQYKRSQEMEAYRQQMIESQVRVVVLGIQYYIIYDTWTCGCARVSSLLLPPRYLSSPLLPFPLSFSFYVAPVGSGAF